MGQATIGNITKPAALVSTVPTFDFGAPAELTRRRFLSRAGAAASAIAVAVPIAAAAEAGGGLTAATDPDAVLIALCEQWHAGEARYLAACNAVDTATEAADDSTPQPAVLNWSKDDIRLIGYRTHEAPGEPWCGPEIREMKRVTFLTGAAERRRLEVIDAFDRWHRDVDAACDAHGVPALEEAVLAISRETKAQLRELSMITAKTPAGLAAKLAIMATLIDYPEDQIGEQLERDLYSDERMTLSIVRDRAVLGVNPRETVTSFAASV